MHLRLNTTQGQQCEVQLLAPRVRWNRGCCNGRRARMQAMRSPLPTNDGELTWPSSRTNIPIEPLECTQVLRSKREPQI
ncbi:hypothetical protein KC19_2G004400 [Ceratodon purpureus]|uniref:Uncharacterized protein n=1 Tax=Ceratodon purpureus TaxID=3225 RepID=A0A8T0IQR4_CERPU|nr:hypothetical protein KC19_2G004400 [Ceratodon purpureus]